MKKSSVKENVVLIGVFVLLGVRTVLSFGALPFLYWILCLSR